MSPGIPAARLYCRFRVKVPGFRLPDDLKVPFSLTTIEIPPGSGTTVATASEMSKPSNSPAPLRTTFSATSNRAGSQ